MKKAMLVLAWALAVVAVAVSAETDTLLGYTRLVGGWEALGKPEGTYEFERRVSNPTPDDWRWVAGHVAELPNVEVVDLQMRRCKVGICGMAKVKFRQ
ncbi:hypothetical protein HYV91_00610 [Candidatus Wolfebacteria bacterium]|nr:hypothetical protein [Candidatus Wolfebacteria bacterium]